jgi:hypothetical protein
MPLRTAEVMQEAAKAQFVHEGIGRERSRARILCVSSNDREKQKKDGEQDGTH